MEHQGQEIRREVFGLNVLGRVDGRNHEQVALADARVGDVPSGKKRAASGHNEQGVGGNVHAVQPSQGNRPGFLREAAIGVVVVMGLTLHLPRALQVRCRFFGLVAGAQQDTAEQEGEKTRHSERG